MNGFVILAIYVFYVVLTDLLVPFLFASIDPPVQELSLLATRCVFVVESSGGIVTVFFYPDGNTVLFFKLRSN